LRNRRAARLGLRLVRRFVMIAARQQNNNEDQE
jgi:hypothetical protein